MIVCPKCKKQLAGNPRSCGYCGNSLVGDYFRQPEPYTHQHVHHLGTGAIASMTLGVFGSIALIGALAFQMAPLFGYGIAPVIDVVWWIRTMAIILPAVIYLVQILVLRGMRFSLLFDGMWLFLSACGLSLTVQAYLERGSLLFYGLISIPYLLVLGCSLLLVASVTGILTYQK